MTDGLTPLDRTIARVVEAIIQQDWKQANMYATAVFMLGRPAKVPPSEEDRR